MKIVYIHLFTSEATSIKSLYLTK